MKAAERTCSLQPSVERSTAKRSRGIHPPHPTKRVKLRTKRRLATGDNLGVAEAIAVPMLRTLRGLHRMAWEGKGAPVHRLRYAPPAVVESTPAPRSSEA